MKFFQLSLQAAVAAALCTGAIGAQDAALQKPATPAGLQAVAALKAPDLYSTTKVWTIQLSFTAEEWAAMEPGSGGTGSGGPGGPGRPGGPGSGGPGGGAGGPGGPGRGGFGPAMFIAPAFVVQGDADADGRLSKAEFLAMGAKWLALWDKEKKGRLSAAEVRAGLDLTFAPPAPGAPPAGGPPGGGGAPGGGPGRSMLLGAEGKRNGLASTMGIEFKYVHADLQFEGAPLKDVAVRYKGNGTFMESRGALKRSLKVDLNKYTKGQRLAGVNTLNLHSSVTDGSWMNEVLSYRLYRDAGVPSPRTAYAKVFLSVPGKFDNQYVGLYSLVEDIDKTFADERFGSKKGVIFKPVTPALFSDLGDDWAKYKQIYDAKDDVSVEDSRRVIEFSRLVTHAGDAEFAARLGEFVELEEFASYMAVTVWLSTLDSILTMGQNYYMYLHPKTHRFQFLPWDLDHSFGQFPMGGSQEQREQLSLEKPWRGNNRFFERCFAVPAFKDLYWAKLKEFSGTIFMPERFEAQVDEVAAAIRGAVQQESEAKLARFDKAVSGVLGGLGGLGGTGVPSGAPGLGNPGAPGDAGRPPNAPPAEAGMPGRGFPMLQTKPIKGFVKARAQSVNDQLAGKSKGISLDQSGPGPGGPPGGGKGMAGLFLGGPLIKAFDSDKDGALTKEEFEAGFARWFESWNSDQSGTLSDEQLRAGINKDLSGPPPGAVPPAPPL